MGNLSFIRRFEVAVEGIAQGLNRGGGGTTSVDRGREERGDEEGGIRDG